MKWEIFFTKENKLSWMCNDYMKIVYKDKPKDNYWPNDWVWITQCDDVIRIFSWWLSIWIDCSKKDKKWFRLFYSNDK